MTTETKDERGGWTSASNAAADRLCQGRHQAQLGIPDSTSEDAKFGREVHEALYAGDPTGLDSQQLSLYEQHLEINEKLMNQFFGPDREAAIIVKERRYWCQVREKPGVEKRFQHSGQPDFIARHLNRVLIVEYKSLPGEVPEPSKNEQLRDQANLVSGTFGIRGDCEIGTAVNQPLVTHSPELCIYRPEDLKISEQQMFDRVRKSNAQDAPRTPNPTSCKFCKAKSKCKEYEAWAESLLPSTTKVVGLPVSEWTPDMRAYYCEMRGTARKWLDDCDAEMKRLLDADPSSIPGWKLEEGATTSVITDAQELFGRFCYVAKEFAAETNPEDPTKLITELFMQCVKVGKEDFKSQVRKVTGLKGKALVAKLEELFAGITEERKNKPSLGRQTQAEMMAEATPEIPIDKS